MKTITCAIALSLSCALSQAQAHKPNLNTAETSAPTTQRYQLFAAQVESQGNTPATNVLTNQVFLLDTQTGQVWRYSAERTIQKRNGEMEEFPDAFIMIEVRQDRYGPPPVTLGPAEQEKK